MSLPDQNNEFQIRLSQGMTEILFESCSSTIKKVGHHPPYKIRLLWYYFFLGRVKVKSLVTASSPTLTVVVS